MHHMPSAPTKLMLLLDVVYKEELVPSRLQAQGVPLPSKGWAKQDKATSKGCRVVQIIFACIASYINRESSTMLSMYIKAYYWWASHGISSP